MKSYKYENIYLWLKKQATEQLLLGMIVVTLFKYPVIITHEYENYWGPIKYNLQKLTRLQIMQGFLPARIWQKQHKYYVYIKSRKQGITWGLKLCEK